MASRETWVWRDGELVEKHLATPLHAEGSSLYVISDTVEGFRSMADGNMYDSKSRYRADLRARGCVEIGNERMERRPTPLPPVRDYMRQAIHQLKG